MSYLLVRGNARRLPIADGSIHCCVTSPPYFGLRDYGVSGQIGLEPTPEAFVAAMVEVFREVRRVLRNDGTLWLNLGDSYATGAGKVGECPGGGEQGDRWNGHRGSRGGSAKQPQTGSAIGPLIQPNRLPLPGLKPKDLIGIPWRVALALQADGWFLRSDIIWAKPNPMPESVTDRPTKSHEYLFLMTKNERYFFDAEAIREDGAGRLDRSPGSRGRLGAQGWQSVPLDEAAGRNRRTVWTVATQPFPGAHFATFPPKLIEPCIKAGTSEKGCCPACGAQWERVTERTRVEPDDYAGKNSTQDPQHSGRRMLANVKARRAAGNPHDNPFPGPKTVGWQPSCSCPPCDPIPCVVLDNFGGAATTAVVATGLGRRAICAELSAEYLALAQRRLERPHATLSATLRDDETLPLFDALT